MKVARLLLLLSAFAMLLVVTSACTVNHRDPKAKPPKDFYRRGNIHQDAFPPGYVPGRYRSNSWGRPW